MLKGGKLYFLILIGTGTVFTVLDMDISLFKNLNQLNHAITIIKQIKITTEKKN
jgi:hypothetical protein